MQLSHEVGMLRFAWPYARRLYLLERGSLWLGGDEVGSDIIGIPAIEAKIDKGHLIVR